MISPESYSNDWILSQCKRLGNTGKEILRHAEEKRTRLTIIVNLTKFEIKNYGT